MCLQFFYWPYICVFTYAKWCIFEAVVFVIKKVRKHRNVEPTHKPPYNVPCYGLFTVVVTAIAKL